MKRAFNPEGKVVRTILSLFDYSGAWSQPYRDAGYNVIQRDMKHGHDIFDENLDGFPEIYGILAAPPCTHFAGSGARWWQEKDQDGRTLGAIALIYKTLEIIQGLKHRDGIKFWVLENPVGRLNTLVPWIKDYGPRYFQPSDFGDPYTKRTGLWGEFVWPRENPVEPIEGSKMWRNYGGKSERTKIMRSITPPGFAQAFFEANT